MFKSFARRQSSLGVPLEVVSEEVFRSKLDLIGDDLRHEIEDYMSQNYGRIKRFEFGQEESILVSYRITLRGLFHDYIEWNQLYWKDDSTAE